MDTVAWTNRQEGCVDVEDDLSWKIPHLLEDTLLLDSMNSEGITRPVLLQTKPAGAFAI